MPGPFWVGLLVGVFCLLINFALRMRDEARRVKASRVTPYLLFDL